MNNIEKMQGFFIDHYHLLFKSAAINHLRIQRIAKNKNGTYQLTIKFDSYSELKRYQKNLRRCTVSFSGALVAVAIAFFVGKLV